MNTGIRNVAIIAHVDHGKTTLVDAMLRQSGLFRANQQLEERILDRDELERERGITILAKNTAILYGPVKINIIDTPGHADFGGEVERVLRMADGALLVVDAFEGPMPQTRFVLRKAFETHLKPIVVINKMDVPNARPKEVLDEVLDLFIELGADEQQIDFPVLYASARQGWASADPAARSGTMRPLFEAILEEVPTPSGDPSAPLQVLVTTLDYNEYLGRIGIGRVVNGTLRAGQPVMVSDRQGRLRPAKVGTLLTFLGLKREEVTEVQAGDIVAVTGIEALEIGETITDPERPSPLPPIRVEAPTISMYFLVNDSPFSGQEGRFVTGRQLKERLLREAETDVALEVVPTASPDTLEVKGRGELHLAILIEKMRREGYELQVSRPRPILREQDGQVQEPYEEAVLYVPGDAVGPVMELLGSRRAEVLEVEPQSGGQVRIRAYVPSRGLIGFRSQLLTETRGEGILYHVFDHYGPFVGELRARSGGAMVATETGMTTAYAIENLQERGVLFWPPGVKVYAGQVVGEHSRPQDITVNICKAKRLTNMRASSADVAVKLDAPRTMDLERSLEWINDDELVEVTPSSVRIRKAPRPTVQGVAPGNGRQLQTSYAERSAGPS
ncbi:translational GTPase TypA [Carboxydochorda subterranea]|uniref:Large ribosomal subunit assembly factor BipA n=1 Tax=Carboxydichorda subterranea TaxID=3109565 RepID=A0ABZ1BZQ4_9FIRM|nr:translational GTPase TypA [Limnochorda sp. L945t]WRP18179.1 translational GTPase TypA [Limnochorda sp. L945t]